MHSSWHLYEVTLTSCGCLAKGGDLFLGLLLWLPTDCRTVIFKSICWWLSAWETNIKVTKTESSLPFSFWKFPVARAILFVLCTMDCADHWGLVITPHWFTCVVSSSSAMKEMTWPCRCCTEFKVYCGEQKQRFAACLAMPKVLLFKDVHEETGQHESFTIMSPCSIKCAWESSHLAQTEPDTESLHLLLLVI